MRSITICEYSLKSHKTIWTKQENGRQRNFIIFRNAITKFVSLHTVILPHNSFCGESVLILREESETWPENKKKQRQLKKNKTEEIWHDMAWQALEFTLIPLRTMLLKPTYTIRMYCIVAIYIAFDILFESVWHCQCLGVVLVCLTVTPQIITNIQHVRSNKIKRQRDRYKFVDVS